MAKVGPNDPCECGSGRKFKKCCSGAPSTGCTVDDRIRALNRLGSAGELMADEEDVALEEFWSGIPGSFEGLDMGWAEQSAAFFDGWWLFDRELKDGRRLVDIVLERPLPPGERRYLEGMREAGARLWEIVEVRPGRSISLVDLIDGTRVTVNERTFSRDATVRGWLAARVNPLGPTGGAELELGALMISGFGRETLRDALKQACRGFTGGPMAFFKTTAPLLHAHWASSIIDPPVPTLRNTDDERMTATRVQFGVIDAAALRSALSTAEGVEAVNENAWYWAGPSQNRSVVTLGTLQLQGEWLTLEANSAERGRRGRELLQHVAGAALRYVATSHEDMERMAKEHMRKAIRGEVLPEAGADTSIPFADQEELVLDHLARYYRGWIDEPVPAIADLTPRAAAKTAGLVPKLIELLHGLEGMYARALKAGDPAYDPSWMWAELGLGVDSDQGPPPPLAHERVGELVDGATEACRELAARLRRDPAFKEASPMPHEAAQRADLGIQRILKERPALAPLLGAMVDFELHRRKTFQVATDLTWTLSHTDLEVAAELVRAPFPSFAMVFTDRHVLSMLERMFAVGPLSPLAGHMLRIGTVYVSEAAPGHLRVLVAGDALGADVPVVREVEIHLFPGGTLSAAIDRAAAGGPGARPLGALLAVVIQAMLYATSVGVEPVLRAAPSPGRKDSGRAAATSESVYYLPGTINISKLRHLRELERTSTGRELLQRFLVRGHWRRPPESWKDQRPRWIAPHWKGPPGAVVIERAYRLEP